MEKEEYRRLFELEDHLWWFAGMNEISLSLLERFCPQTRPLSILDAGCGTGGMLPHLTGYGPTVGIDLSRDALDFAHRRETGHLARASLDQLPFPAETFDLVTSFDVIYHRAIPDDEVALTEIARVLRPGGTLLLRVPAHEGLRSQHDEAVHTRQRYGRTEVVDKLRRIGFRPLYVTYANCFLFPIAAVKRLVEGHLPGGKEGSDVKPVPAILNRLLLSVLRLEARVVKRFRLPFGLSLIAVASRQPHPNQRPNKESNIVAQSVSEK
jgi:SAM-dependent methyltransferase